ncbi:MAG: hypothetical protein NTY01_13940 [Verrucomicrobia bacterium]|nr:hypothetical protein [Verrucomicrobiota bacterium]
MLEEYYRKFFGKAAVAMKSFYDILEAGYTEWLVRTGKPHLFGPDAGSLKNHSSMSQFSVLPIALATKAQGWIDYALATAGNDPQVVERIKLVKAIYGFAVPGARAHWACERLRNVRLASFADTGRVVADAREAIDGMLALAEYKFAVMEKPEVKAYSEHDDKDALYKALERGAVSSDVVSKIGLAFQKVSTFLRGMQGPANTQAWWDQQQRTEQRPMLLQLMKTAAANVSAPHLKNQVEDPSFEKRGPQQSASNKADSLAAAKRARVNVYSNAGSPVQCSLTTETAHTGRYSFAFWDTQRASVIETVDVKPGDSLSLSVWVKHNKAQGGYTVEVVPRGPKGTLARTVIAVPQKPDEWQKLDIPFVVPPDATSVILSVFVQNQSPGARIWVDDFFIGKRAAN